ncbi:hypothetical protein [Nissabacter sp. SGAir0207]|uniref:hypothetical protein n=1 Tax=Nissabacter sp. SGAir0207 TaxID=2126321 RepID=UPI0010CD51B1|nr:hypothetical protein [Nissabacter sp. SGAir0207]QCR38903.1 hypothetical protein C1N62_22600 [Nissabacter sp. SGAir0207]
MHAWIITKDVKKGIPMNTLGPQKTCCKLEDVASLGIPFRLLDEGFCTCYEGVFLGQYTDRAAPLLEFPVQAEKVVQIQYRQESGEWM